MSDTTSKGGGADGWRYPYGSTQRYHLQHIHLFASDLDASIAFYRRWFDAQVMWDGAYADARNVFMRIGIGALHFYDQAPRDLARNAVHHLGIQVVGLHDLYERMKDARVRVPNPIRESEGSGYFMAEAPDRIVLELFEPGPARPAEVQRYYGYGDVAARAGDADGRS